MSLKELINIKPHGKAMQIAAVDCHTSTLSINIRPRNVDTVNL
jgi:hypothetical protein